MKKKGLYLLHADSFTSIYSPDERQRVEQSLDLVAPPQTIESIAADPAPLANAEIILSGWGCVHMDADFLVQTPKLEAVFYGAGSIRAIVSEAFWDRDIVITSAYGANAIPVAEYALSQILFGLKCGWQTRRHMRETRRWQHASRDHAVGAYGATVGLVSLGMVARHVCRLLQAFDLRVIAYDPFVSDADAAALGVTLVPLDEVFRQSRIVSLHTPNLPETAGMITAEHFRAMQPFSTFINTARGAVIREPEMIDVLKERPDLVAILDVASPEPPAPASPLWTLPNVVLTPHLAGSINAECHRMGRYAVDELIRYLNGEPLQWRITRDQAKTLA